MDQSLLVRPDVPGAQAFVRLMDRSGKPARLVAWVWREDTDDWRLFVLPAAGFDDREAFRRWAFDLLATPEGRETGIDPLDLYPIKEGDPNIATLTAHYDLELGAETLGYHSVGGTFYPPSVYIRVKR